MTLPACGCAGLAKTLPVSSLARTMFLSFKRIQFTPDLTPSDITGVVVHGSTLSSTSTQSCGEGTLGVRHPSPCT